MESELHNLLRCCVNPIVGVRTIFFFVTRILFSFQYRYIPPVWQYPKEVRAMLSREGEKVNPPLRVRGDRGVTEGEKLKGRLKLATGFLEYDGTPDWHKEFDDTEQTMSLHRWGWLIYGGMDKEQGFAFMRSWLGEMGSVPSGIAGTPYTTSERVVNALLFLSDKSIPDDLRTPLLAMAFHVARNIEYHGVRGTGNHVINNARALLFAGQILNVKELSDLALATIRDALPWLVNKDGFLREESSHYHLLFTRWLVEMYELVKETHNEEVQSYLAPWVKICAERCWFFLVKDERTSQWDIPLIGDVSPDCTPGWLIEYLMPLLQSYQSPSPQSSPIKGEEGEKNYPPRVGGVRGGGGPKMQAFTESGWFRLDRGPLTIFWHIPQENMIHRPTHGHGDVCSFVLFSHGKPILIDPGRPTYKVDDPLYKYSGSARAHNSLVIDGFDPFLYDRAQKFPEFYQQRKVEVNWKEESELFIFSITHTGFYRIYGNRIDCIRRFYVGHNSLQVEDELRGARRHAVEVFFHPAPEAKVAIENIGQSEEIRDDMSWTSPAYGVTIPSKAIMISVKRKFPFKVSHHLKW